MLLQVYTRFGMVSIITFTPIESLILAQTQSGGSRVNRQALTLVMTGAAGERTGTVRETVASLTSGWWGLLNTFCLHS